jgi:AcrR family transcriptional regulator
VAKRRRLSRAESQNANRRELLRAASRLFLRNGFVATSLADIAEEAGVTKGAVYSNFASKEDLFLALLDEPLVSTETYAPSRVDDLTGDTAARGREFGRYAASVRPSVRHVALFLETNAAALRSDRVRRHVADNTRQFAAVLGQRLGESVGVSGVDPVKFGLVVQSLFAGLMMHGAFLSEIDDELFAAAYEMLLIGARVRSESVQGQSV